MLNNLLNNNLLNNDLVIICLISGVVCLTTGYFIKTFFYSSPINTPQTFNFTHEQLKELQHTLDKGDALDKEIQDKLDQDIEQILGEENYAEFQQELQQIQADFDNQLQDIFNNVDFSNIINSGIDYSTILELIDIINNLINYWF
jgi:hypothetical protein